MVFWKYNVDQEWWDTYPNCSELRGAGGSKIIFVEKIRYIWYNIGLEKTSKQAFDDETLRTKYSY